MRHSNTRQEGQNMDTYGEGLILNALRILQDCPTNGIALRKVGLSYHIEVDLLTLYAGTHGRFSSLNGHSIPPCIATPDQ